jgi:hypothetical protein
VALKCSFTPPDEGTQIDVVCLPVRADADGTVVSFVNLGGHEAHRLADVVRRFKR